MKLIVEQKNPVDVIVEETSMGKDYYIEGIFLQAELKNRNGRIYPMDVMQREVDRYTREYVQEDRAIGELNHPPTAEINLDRVSHKIVNIWREGNNFHGKAKILDTPMGKIAKNLIDGGIKLGVSSRGVGSVKRVGDTAYIKEDFHLVTAGDIVADPSAPDAFVRNLYESVGDEILAEQNNFTDGILESKEWVWRNGVLVESSVDEDVVLEKFEKLLKNVLS